jgi:hypothetical protein
MTSDGISHRSGRVGYTPTAGNHGTPLFKGKGSADCSECGFVWTQPERGYDLYNEIMNHMVEKHGYKRVGSQVFRSTVCAGPGCKKPGLYKVNMSGYTFCSDHKQLAVDRCFLRTLRLDKGRNETDLNLNAEDARMRSLDSSHSLTKANRKLSGR